MPLFDWLFGKDPTGDWAPAPSIAPEYDFDRHALCGVKIGSPVEAFAKLGRAEDSAKARKGQLYYYRSGLQLDVEEGHVMDFVIFWTDDWSDPSHQPRPFPGKLRAGGRELRWGPQTLEQEILNILGEPSGREVDEDEIVLRCTRGRVTYEFELSTDGQLRAMIVIGEDRAR
jgi:hypothetical protein